MGFELGGVSFAWFLIHQVLILLVDGPEIYLTSDLLDPKVWEFNPRYAEVGGALLGRFLDLNMNICRYINTGVVEQEIDWVATYGELVAIEAPIQAATVRPNAFLKEQGLPLLGG